MAKAKLKFPTSVRTFAKHFKVTKSGITDPIRKYKKLGAKTKTGRIGFKFRGKLYFAIKFGNQYLIDNK